MTLADTWVIVASGAHQRGGMERANAALVRYLLGQDAAVHLVVHDAEPELAENPRATVHRVPLPLGVTAFTDWTLDRKGRRVATQVLSTRPHARVVVNGGNCVWPDVNWVHYLHHAWAPVTREGPTLRRLKDQVVGASSRRRERRALQVARWVVTNSDSTAHTIQRHVPEAADRVRRVYLGSERNWSIPSERERHESRARLCLDPETPVVVFVGGLGFDHRKGFDTLWKAWRALRASNKWNAILLVAGDGPALDYWRGVSDAGGDSESTRFLGFTPNVRELLAAADLLVSPTRYEPYGLNVQEALCRGVPAIVSASAGVAERYPASLTGWLLSNPDDPLELADCLRRWSAQPDQWRDDAARLAETLRAYGWDDMAHSFVAAVTERDLVAPAS